METASQKNTILKMAKKRALVDAVLGFATLSEVFTQDLEDIDPDSIVEGSVGRTGTSRPAAQQGQQQRRTTGGQQGQAAKAKATGTCPEHNRPWGATPDGEISHPMGDGQWCIKGGEDRSETAQEPPEETQPDGQEPDERQEMEAYLTDLGWTWEEFETAVLSMSWEEFLKLGGNKEKATVRLERYMEGV